jgi:hypothetical protein
VENIQWQDPPPTKGKHYPKGRYVAIANALRKRPLEWAIVSLDSQGNLASYIKNGTALGFAPAGSFEAVSRVNPGRQNRNNPRCTIYARFIG